MSEGKHYLVWQFWHQILSYFWCHENAMINIVPRAWTTPVWPGLQSTPRSFVSLSDHNPNLSLHPSLLFSDLSFTSKPIPLWRFSQQGMPFTKLWLENREGRFSQQPMGHTCLWWTLQGDAESPKSNKARKERVLWAWKLYLRTLDLVQEGITK